MKTNESTQTLCVKKSAHMKLLGATALMAEMKLTDTTKPLEKLLNAEQVAARLAISRKHARTMMSDGTLPKVCLGRRCVRTLASAVEELITKRTIIAR